MQTETRQAALESRIREEESRQATLTKPEGPRPKNSVLVDGFGDRVRLARLRAGLTQMQLAVKAGLSRQSLISKIERGVQESNFTTVVSIARVLNVSLDWLANGNEAQYKNPPV